MTQILLFTATLLASADVANSAVLLTSNLDGNDITVSTNASNIT